MELTVPWEERKENGAKMRQLRKGVVGLAVAKLKKGKMARVDTVDATRARGAGSRS